KPLVAVEVKFTDGSVMKLRLKDERFTLFTPYGKLLIPFADIDQIEFATRVPEDIAKEISRAIEALGHTEQKKRTAAVALLVELNEKAYPALLKAEKSKDAEVKKRAQEALRKIRAAVPEELLEIREHDIVRTKVSRITGRIDASSFRAETVQFGSV